MARKQKTKTLSDADILTTPKVQRRSLLGMAGKGVIGAAAIATGLIPTRSRAVDSDLGPNADPVGGGVDADMGPNADLIGGGVDADIGPNADPVGGGSDPVDSDAGRNADTADTD